MSDRWNRTSPAQTSNSHYFLLPGWHSNTKKILKLVGTWQLWQIFRLKGKPICCAVVSRKGEIPAVCLLLAKRACSQHNPAKFFVAFRWVGSFGEVRRDKLKIPIHVPKACCFFACYYETSAVLEGEAT